MTFPTFADLLSITAPAVFVTGFAVFVARIFDVSIGTIRTIVTVQGRTAIAVFLGSF